jgi:hypothetical protein
MNDENKKIIKDQLAILPEDVKNAITSVDYQKTLQKITRTNMLLIDQAGKLETETTLVLLGLEPLRDYAGNLSKNLGITKEKAIVIAHDVDELIFKNIRESLRKINDDMLAGEGHEMGGGGSASGSEPTRDAILGGIENPSVIPKIEKSVSVSSLKSNSANPEYPAEKFADGVEVKKETSMELEIPPEAMVPATTVAIGPKVPPPFHENISPLDNIVEEKLSAPVEIPKASVVVEENTKLPPKPAEKHDPYREPIV